MERRQDKLLGIKTTGMRECSGGNVHYNRYEATPYKALDILSENYDFRVTDKFVDFGCGRGRVAFYIHNRFNIPVTGIEADYRTYIEALENRESYCMKTGRAAKNIEIIHGLAQDYEIGNSDNCFYFFNPFSVQIFRRVVQNILRSVGKNKRTVDLILFYPSPEYRDFLDTETPFRVEREILIPGERDEREKFIIYRLHEGDWAA